MSFVSKRDAVPGIILSSPNALTVSLPVPARVLGYPGHPEGGEVAVEGGVGQLLPLRAAGLTGGRRGGHEPQPQLAARGRGALWTPRCSPLPGGVRGRGVGAVGAPQDGRDGGLE